MAALSRVLDALRPVNLTGPILAKELRVGSRRRRNYVLRMAYILLMALVVGAAWFAISANTAGTYQVSRMAVVGQQITGVVAWFQFWAMQVIAVVLCSTSISDEVSRRTLGVLMTTPITSVQIVVGKMLSRLLQLLLLLAISLPILAVVRVFGGVPWGSLISTTCITATATLLAAAVSMFFSVYSRHAYSVIIRSFLFGLCFSFIGPTIVGMMFPLPSTWMGLLLLNPTMMMAVQSHPLGRFFGSSGPVLPGWWMIHCGIMLGLSCLIMMWCAARVRRVALREIVGAVSNNPVPLAQPMARPAVAYATAIAAASSPVTGMAAITAVPDEPMPGGRASAGQFGTGDDYYRPITGSPVTWKEARAPLIRGTRGVIGLLVLCTLLLMMYGLAATHDSFDHGESHALFLALYLVVAIIDTCSLGGASIAAEREANTWTLLLTTPLSNWDIIRGKLIGVFRRSMPAWGFLLAHTLLFVLLGRINLVGAVMTLWICGYTAIFLGSLGVYFSARLRKTSAAVSATLFVALVIWLLVAGLAPCGVFGPSASGPGPLFMVNPVFQIVMVMGGTAGKAVPSPMVFEMLGDSPANQLSDAIALLLVSGLVYILIAGMLLGGACRNVRRGDGN